MRVVAERDGLILLCPFAGRQPYELLVAPLACEERSVHERACSARRSRSSPRGCGGSAWPRAPCRSTCGSTPAGHWHLEILPRLRVLAGLELGAGYFVNTLAPESAAGVLRRVLDG